MKLTDRQIKILRCVFPVTVIIGPVGIPLNIILYGILIYFYFVSGAV